MLVSAFVNGYLSAFYRVAATQYEDRRRCFYTAAIGYVVERAKRLALKGIVHDRSVAINTKSRSTSKKGSLPCFGT
jgi:hypothetical protein